MNELTHIDICSGGGGFSIAAGWAGFHTLAFAEVEPFPCYVLSQLWPGITNLGDLRRITVNPFGTAPIVLTGGIPCQPASAAGKRLGSADARWLWPEAIRLLGVFRPRYAIFENPAGILSVCGNDGQRELPRILAGIHRAGYHAWWQDLSAAEFGASHGRNRIWIVCVRMDDPMPIAGGTESQQQQKRNSEFGGTSDVDDAKCPQRRPHNVAGGYREQGINRKGQAPGGPGESSTVENAFSISIGRRAGWGEAPGGWPYDDVERSSVLVANAGRERSQGLCEDGAENRAIRRSSRAEIPQHPPSPSDRDGWAAVLERAPWLAPAVEPGVCWLADGLSLPVDSSRVAVLSLLGNAIHPECVYPFFEAIRSIERGS